MLSSARRTRGPAILFILLIAALLAACGAAGTAAPGATGAPAFPGAGGPQTGGDGDPDGGPDGDPDGNGNGEGNGDGDGIPLGAPIDLLIIKNGSLALQVEVLDAGMAAANQLITGLGGYASASDREGDDEFAQATVTYRIPVDRWDDALNGLRGLAQKVLAERYSTDDVTTQVVDLGARIANLQTTEAALQAIMDRAVEIEDVLKVQSELTQVRGQIESLTAQKTNLEGQAAFSTLAVTFALKPDPILTEQQGFDPANEVERASASLVGVLQALATAGIWFAIVWIPILVGLAIVVGLVVFVIRRVSRRLEETAPEAPLPTPEGGA